MGYNMSTDNDLRVAEAIGELSGKMDSVLSYIEKQNKIPERVSSLETRQKVIWGITGAPAAIAIAAFIKTFFFKGVGN